MSKPGILVSSRTPRNGTTSPISRVDLSPISYPYIFIAMLANAEMLPSGVTNEFKTKMLNDDPELTYYSYRKRGSEDPYDFFL